MGLQEKTAQVFNKAVFGYRIGFDSTYRTKWLADRLQGDLKQGTVSPEVSERILAQSANPKTSRHVAETFAIPLIAAIAGSAASLQTFNYAWETGDALAWGYTLSHLAVHVPKISYSSVLRGVLLSASVVVDHIQDQEVGSWSRIKSELRAIGTTSVSWMGAGNIGPGMRMIIGAPDLGPYLMKDLAKQDSVPRIKQYPQARKQDRDLLYYQSLAAIG